MRINVGDFDMKSLMDGIEGDLAEAASLAMRDTTYKALLELREQVTSAGMGQRLANTWRDRVFPEKRRSMTPSGYIWSNAPDIIDAFSRGAQIVPLSGRRFLAIPTKNVPSARGRRNSSSKMTPAQVENAFNQDLFFKRGRAGRVLAFINAVGALNGRGFRVATKGRRAQGRDPKPVLMFVMVPSVRLPRVLDLDVVAQRWAANFEARFTAQLGAK